MRECYRSRVTTTRTTPGATRANARSELLCLEYFVSNPLRLKILPTTAHIGNSQLPEGKDFRFRPEKNV
jgi:hypothetical protein